MIFRVIDDLGNRRKADPVAIHLIDRVERPRGCSAGILGNAGILGKAE